MILFTGIPRSGTTLLASLLNQRSDVQVTALSTLVDTLGTVVISQPRIDDILPVLKGIINNYHPKTDKIIIDKSWTWADAKVLDTMTQIDPNLKVIVPVRRIDDCIASFMRISKWQGTAEEFIRHSPLAERIFQTHLTIQQGYAKYAKHFIFVDYDNLLNNPQHELDRIACFCRLPKFKHDFSKIVNPTEEDDINLWGIPGLHKIKPILGRQNDNTKEILGSKVYNFLQGSRFWKNEPPAVDEKADAILHAIKTGQSTQISELVTWEDSDRAIFNSSTHFLNTGRLLEGFKRLKAGKNIGLFGTKAGSNQPEWTGQDINGKIVLLNLGGGLGDQIWAARFVKPLVARGAKVILSGDPLLAELLLRVDGVSAFIDSRAQGGVYHDYWLDGFLAVIPLGWEYKDVDGESYIKRLTPKTTNKKLRVGLVWQGNQDNTIDEHRRFNPTPLFNLQGVTLVNLQRDWEVPSLEKSDLSTWTTTSRAIETLDLVISSCTSVAHCAAAMGVTTWIIVPKHPYIFWNLPGNQTPWYNSVRLYRQCDEMFSHIAKAMSSGVSYNA